MLTDEELVASVLRRGAEGRQRTCLHESSHAVVAVLYDVEFTRVEVTAEPSIAHPFGAVYCDYVPDEDLSRLLHAASLGGPLPEGPRARLEARVAMGLAGEVGVRKGLAEGVIPMPEPDVPRHLAERRRRLEYVAVSNAQARAGVTSFWSDEEIAKDLAETISPDEAAAKVFLDWMGRRVEWTLAQPPVWAAVLQVARELDDQNELTFEEVRTIVQPPAPTSTWAQDRPTASGYY
jgi:hypothetical protein